MRFESKYFIRHGSIFVETIQKVLPLVINRNIYLVCILNKISINCLEEARKFADWARSLKVRGVIFRELSRLPNDFQSTKGMKWIEKNRISIDTIVQEKILKGLRNVTIGYYYYNEEYDGNLFIDSSNLSSEFPFTVILETSCYETLDRITQSERNYIRKFVFHSNGNLTAGWSADRDIVTSM